jgi:hypothetical protein
MLAGGGTMADDVILKERLQRLERRANLLLAVAVLGAGLGAAGLYAGLRERPRPRRIVIEDASGKMVLTPTMFGMMTRDETRMAAISLGTDNIRMASLTLSTGGAAGEVLLSSTTNPADGKGDSSASAALQLGDMLADAQVRLDNLGSGGDAGPSLKLHHGSVHDRLSDTTTIAHTRAGPRVSTHIGGVARETVLRLDEVAPPSPPAPAPAPAP